MENNLESLSSRSNEHDPEKVAVLVAWPYGNGPRHLGHGASLVPGDVIARYHRSLGDDVLMVSGTDEYGTPNLIAAEKNGQDTKDFVDSTNEIIREDFIKLGMSFDWFTRTTTKDHEEVAQNFFSKLVDAGFIKKDTMLGAFDEETGQSLPDRYVEGGCPHCSADARGDQCEECNSLLDPTDLINPHSKITNNPVEFAETEHYFLQLDKLAGDVSEWLDSNDELRPNAKSSSMKAAEELRPRAITRDMNWGIPLPEGYELDGKDEKVLYVWFEAVTGYLSASVEWAKSIGEPDAWKEWWQDDEARHYYVMGKDNVPFHTLIWPAMIAAANESEYSDSDLHQPDVIASTEYLNFGEGKFSTSRGNVVYISDMLDLVGPDALRYYLVVAGPETRDTVFSFEELTRRVNDELIAKWGNLVNRSTNMIEKNHAGKIPNVDINELDETSIELLSEINNAYDEIGDLINNSKFSAALKKAVSSASLVNKYIENNEPWVTAKSDPEKAAKDMFTVITAIQNVNILFSPFLPHASQKIHSILGNSETISTNPKNVVVDGEDGLTVLSGDYKQDHNHWKFSFAKGGQSIQTNGEVVFKKLDSEDLEKDFNSIAQRRKIGKISL